MPQRSATLLASAARTATVNSDDREDPTSQSAHVIVNVSAVTATPSIVVTIQGKDSVSGAYYDLLASPAITATGTTVLKIGQGLAATPNGSASDFLPEVWRVRVVHGDADSITYSVAANLGD
jgi:hypothetical protein